MTNHGLAVPAARICIALAAITTPSTVELRAAYECRQEAMAGVWAEELDAEMVEREGMDIFPPPGPFSFIGILELDETGAAIQDRHTNSSADGPARPDLLRFFDVRLTVNPDCTGKRVLSLRHDLPSDHPFLTVFGLSGGDVVIEMDVVCADGQQECWGTPTIPAYQIGNWRMRRVEPGSSLLAGRLERIMRRLGLVP